MSRSHHWTEHGVHSSPLADEVPLLSDVAHAAWHLLDEGGEHPTDPGLYVVSASDWQRLSDALDAAGWSADSHANARETGARMLQGRSDNDTPALAGAGVESEVSGSSASVSSQDTGTR